jgi:hypothetical protein
MNRIITLTLSLLVLMFVLIGLACGPGSNSNANLGSNGANSNANAQGEKVFDASADKACNEANLDNRQQQVNAVIGNMIANNDDLAAQKNANVFNYRVVKASGANANTLHLYFEGDVVGADYFRDLTKIQKYFIKKTCAGRVIYVKYGTFQKSADDLAPSDGFQWTACDYPEEPCPDGTCSRSCATLYVSSSSSSAAKPDSPTTSSNAAAKPSNKP